MTAMHEFKADLFKTLGHPVRLRILELLRTGEKTVTELQQDLAIEASSVSQQLAVMRSHQLVEARKLGTNVFYTVRDDLVFDLLDIARKIFENRVESMKMVLDQDGTGD
ncbi:MAG: transcriptional regulator [Sulfobacillus benefaciens]|jgi:ArsR family transcriptional regulator|uniref:Transcriptional regulator n=1 Tax=Sulfobacillus benefaciens TaxID=453960 RepID=A0A2T2XKK1_9FIRM|nr:MAG: transcriptional regulator [Sulfobacillus benefaciens]